MEASSALTVGRSDEAFGVGISFGVAGVVACGALGVAADKDFTTCPFRLLTGQPCPFCGVTHSLLALGGGHIGESFAFSPIGPLTLAVAGVFLGAAAWAALRSRPLRIPRSSKRTLITVVLAVWVVRLAASF